MDSKIDSNFERLKFEQEKFLQLSDDKISQWNKFKDDYLTLRKRLETLPDELRYNIMVPISKVAYMPGRLVNTNEILVLLGDNWFVEKSAKQACELIDRRLKSIDSHLIELGKENKVFKDQLEWTRNLMEEKNDYLNIEEKMDSLELTSKKRTQLSEDQKRDLRRKQQEKALKHQIKIDEYLKDSAKSVFPNIEEDETEEKILVKKNEIIIEREQVIPPEEAKGKNENKVEAVQQVDEEEFDRLVQEYNKTIDRKNNEEIEKKLKSVIDANKRRVKWLDKSENPRIVDDDEDEDNISESTEEEDDQDSDDLLDEDKEVDASKPVQIKIKHTHNEKLVEIERNLAVSRDKCDINSPADIYTHFYKPKSILKNSTTITTSRDETDLSSHIRNTQAQTMVERSASEIKSEIAKFEPKKAFTGEIVERQPIKNETMSVKTQETTATSSKESTIKKSVSKFKASKNNQ